METLPRPPQAPTGTHVRCQKCPARITLPRADEITGRNKYQTRNGGVTPCRECEDLFHTRCLAERAKGSRGQFSTCSQHEHEDARLVVLLPQEEDNEEKKGSESGDDEPEAAPPRRHQRPLEEEDDEYVPDQDDAATEDEDVEAEAGFATPATRARTSGTPDGDGNTGSGNNEQPHAKRQKRATRESSASQQTGASRPSDQAAPPRQVQLKTEQLKKDHEKLLFLDVVYVMNAFSTLTPEDVMKLYNIRAVRAKPPIPEISVASVLEQANALGIQCTPMGKGKAPVHTAGPAGHRPWTTQENVILEKFIDEPRINVGDNFKTFQKEVTGTDHDHKRSFSGFRQHLEKRRKPRRVANEAASR